MIRLYTVRAEGFFIGDLTCHSEESPVPPSRLVAYDPPDVFVHCEAVDAMPTAR